MLTRVNEAYLAKFIQLLRIKLGESYDKRSEVELDSYLRCALTSPEFYFVCTDNAIGLVQKVNVRMRRKPDIEEIFVLGLTPEYKDECKEIYRAAYSWGKNIGAQNFVLDNCNQMTKEDFKELFTKISQDVIPFTRLI